MNRGVRARPRARSAAMSTSKPMTRAGSSGSASTNGAPPSASPPHRSSEGACAWSGNAVVTASAHISTKTIDRSLILRRSVLCQRVYLSAFQCLRNVYLTGNFLSAPTAPCTTTIAGITTKYGPHIRSISRFGLTLAQLRINADTPSLPHACYGSLPRTQCFTGISRNRRMEQRHIRRRAPEFHR